MIFGESGNKELPEDLGAIINSIEPVTGPGFLLSHRHF
jgi:hypothetical protein